MQFYYFNLQGVNIRVCITIRSNSRPSLHCDCRIRKQSNKNGDNARAQYPERRV